MLIEKFKSERRKTPTKAGKPRRPASINRELECLSSIFSIAMRKPHRLISENPCREVTKLLEENQRNRYLSAEEEERLLAACVGDRAHLRPIIILALNTGMRRGGKPAIEESRSQFGHNEKARAISALANLLNLKVGAIGFEPTTSRSRTERSTRLSHAPL
jgi:integrase